MIELVFFIVGVIIVIGFLSIRFFEKTGIPDVIILMLVGALLGSTLVADKSMFNEISPYVGAIALMMILFEGGLHLNISRVLNELMNAVGFTITTFALSAFGIMNVLHYAFGWSFYNSLLLGAVLGGSSSAVVILLISKIKLTPGAKTILSLESAITDALCIVVTLTLLQLMMVESTTLRGALGDFIGVFSIAIVLGALFSLAWIGILKQFYGKSFAYLLTIAVILIMYSTVEFVKGNGAISVLTFGLVLGNYSHVARVMKVESDFSLDQLIKKFHTEISFFIRTFFFVYLGLIFDWNALILNTVFMAAAVLSTLFIVRVFVVKLLTMKDKQLRENQVVLSTMLPRGLAAAVLASAPLTAGLIIPAFQDVVILTIFSSSLIATIGTYLHSKETKEEGKEQNNKKQ